MRLERLACTAVLGWLTISSAPSALVAAESSPIGDAWWAHVQYLASDDMKGRLTGSPEYLKAAAYVVDQFKKDGLHPAGVNGGFYQPVHFDVQKVIAGKSSMSLVVDGKSSPVTLGTDAILGARGAQVKTVDAPLVFIGYGLHLPESNYDDFNSPGLPISSLKGKIVVYINGGPADLPGPLKSYARTAPFAKALKDAGAIGAISIPTPKSMDFGWQRVASGASQPGMRLSAEPGDAAVAAKHPALEDDHSARFSATWNPAEAEKLFAGTGHTFADLLAAADAQKPLSRFALGKTLGATVAGETDHVESPNIAAVLEGSDPKLKGEYVMVSAHLDHLGIGAPIHGKTVYAGAMDDASGVATVLEVARLLTSPAARRPRRSVLFVIFTAEEKGLLGSRYFAGHPTVPQGSIVADLNSDMPMPIFPLKKLHVQGLEQSSLQVDARETGAERGIEIAADPEPDRNSFIRTDQYSFVQAGVPALAFKFGWTFGSPEYKAWRSWLAERYHSTDDDLKQPMDLKAAGEYTHFIGALATRVANDASRPHYLDSSFFRRFETGQ